MGYAVSKLIKGDMVSIAYETAVQVEVKQNHLFLLDKEGATIAVYQSGWWIDCIRLVSDESSRSTKIHQPTQGQVSHTVSRVLG